MPNLHADVDTSSESSEPASCEYQLYTSNRYINYPKYFLTKKYKRYVLLNYFLVKVKNLKSTKRFFLGFGYFDFYNTVFDFYITVFGFFIIFLFSTTVHNCFRKSSSTRQSTNDNSLGSSASRSKPVSSQVKSVS